nr:MAG TPA: hypothetical protein [Caudoviricetes sp.]
MLAGIALFLNIDAVAIANPSQQEGLAITTGDRGNLLIISINDLDACRIWVSNNSQHKAVLQTNCTINDLKESAIQANTAVPMNRHNLTDCLSFAVVKRDDLFAILRHLSEQSTIPRLAASSDRLGFVYCSRRAVADDAINHLQPRAEIDSSTKLCHNLFLPYKQSSLVYPCQSTINYAKHLPIFCRCICRKNGINIALVRRVIIIDRVASQLEFASHLATRLENGRCLKGISLAIAIFLSDGMTCRSRSANRHGDICILRICFNKCGRAISHACQARRISPSGLNRSPKIQWSWAIRADAMGVDNPMLIHIQVCINHAIIAKQAMGIHISLGCGILVCCRCCQTSNFVVVQVNLGFNRHSAICVANGLNPHDVVAIHVKVASHWHRAVSLEVAVTSNAALDVHYWSALLIFCVVKLFGIKQIAAICRSNRCHLIAPP